MQIYLQDDSSAKVVLKDQEDSMGGRNIWPVGDTWKVFYLNQNLSRTILLSYLFETV